MGYDTVIWVCFERWFECMFGGFFLYIQKKHPEFLGVTGKEKNQIAKLQQCALSTFSFDRGTVG